MDTAADVVVVAAAAAAAEYDASPKTKLCV